MSQDRLDSWKEIADYLGRDVRTAMRWAKAHGLPVRRVAGKGRSVFAFRIEIDEWLAGRATPAPQAQAPVDTQPDRPPEPAELQTPVAHRRVRWGWIAATFVLGVIGISTALMAAMARDRLLEPSAIRIFQDRYTVSITDAAGAARVVYRTDPAFKYTFVQHAGGPGYPAVDVNGDGAADILASFADAHVADTNELRSGELLSLTPTGTVQWRFAFDDTVRFTEETYGAPWTLAAWEVSPASPARRIAVTAHHHMWWPSLVTILNAEGTRIGTFVHSGWIDSLVWIDDTRLAIAGFGNAGPEGAGVFAVLDSTHVNGAGPNPSGEAKYDCQTCPEGAPLLYVRVPRSELNHVLGARFNRARVELAADGLLLQTDELESDPPAVPAGMGVLQFDRDLRLLHSSYSDQYWDMHRKLELEGKVSHSRTACPDRNGPRGVTVWDREYGWRPLTTGGNP